MSRKLALKRITLVVFLIASINLVGSTYDLCLESIERERVSRETGWTSCTFGPPFHYVSRFRIELCLIVALIGSRFKRLNNTILSTIGLTSAVISYIIWWRYIFNVARNAETNIENIPNFAYLAGGNFLDVVIAVSVGVLVLFNVRDAALSFVSVDDR